MPEIEPARHKTPTGREKSAILGRLAYARYRQEPIDGGLDRLGVTMLMPINHGIGIRFEELDPVFQRGLLEDAGINPAFAAEAAPLLPAVRAVTQAIGAGVSAEKVIATIYEATA